MDARKSIWALVDSLARRVLNVPREVGSDDCNQDRAPAMTDGEFTDWEAYWADRELGDPGA